MYRILIIVIVLILYGSLYPWEWYLDKIDDPARLLRSSIFRPLDRFLLLDVAINLLLYLPVGVSAFFSFKPSRSIESRAVSAVLIGIALSVCVELLQVVSVTRHPSVIDVIANGAGTGLGALFAIVFKNRLAPMVSRSQRLRPRDRMAFGLLACWYATLLIPFFPVLSRSKMMPRIEQFLRTPALSYVPLLSAVICWIAAGYLFQACGLKRVWRYLLATALLIPAQVFIINREPQLSEFAGALIGSAAFALLPQKPQVAAWSFLALLLLRGLAPFTLQGHANFFAWIPFGGFLEMPWDKGLLLVLEKLFYYGVAIWILRFAGIRLGLVTAIVAGMLALIEIAQIYLPLRTPEITEPILAILLGVVLDSLKEPSRSQLPATAKVD